MPTKKRTWDAIKKYRNTEVTETVDDRGTITERRVKLHDTTIYTMNYASGRLLLNSGGWYTDVTKRRMNECLTADGLAGDIGVAQKKGRWMLRIGADVDAYCGHPLDVGRNRILIRTMSDIELISRRGERIK